MRPLVVKPDGNETARAVAIGLDAVIDADDAKRSARDDLIEKSTEQHATS
jgi:hypothetical protein